MGQGVARTRAGEEPGGMVTTIRQVGPAILGAGAQPAVQWNAPIG